MKLTNKQCSIAGRKEDSSIAEHKRFDSSEKKQMRVKTQNSKQHLQSEAREYDENWLSETAALSENVTANQKMWLGKSATIDPLEVRKKTERKEVNANKPTKIEVIKNLNDVKTDIIWWPMF